MKFVHIADVHLDAPFANLSEKEQFGITRRVDQRKILEDIINYINQNEVPYFFISGDLYEHKYIRQSTIEYINNLFKQIPNTKIFISPGNHDPFIKNSFYNNYIWNNNVTIFKGNLQKISLDDVNIYGYGFTDFYSPKVNFQNIELEKDKLNILVIHGSLYSSESADMQYNPISTKELQTLGFDYVALGHIHKRNFTEEAKNQRIIYPGSTISLGFDEMGSHGIIVGDITKEDIKLQFIEKDHIKFDEEKIDVTDINSEDELIQIINNLKLNSNTFYKIILIGKRNFEINISKLKKTITNQYILKIKDLTRNNYNIEKISKETTLSGMFAQELLSQIKNDPLNEAYYNDILEVGLEILNK